jgi:alpha-tubulin suppressor-like RCC1 family protein
MEESPENGGYPPNSAMMIARVYCGASHSLAVTQAGHLFAWGKNNQGQCGHGHTNDQLQPAEVTYFSDMELKIHTVAGGTRNRTSFSSIVDRKKNETCDK